MSVRTAFFNASVRRANIAKNPERGSAVKITGIRRFLARSPPQPSPRTRGRESQKPRTVGVIADSTNRRGQQRAAQQIRARVGRMGQQSEQHAEAPAPFGRRFDGQCEIDTALARVGTETDRALTLDRAVGAMTTELAHAQRAAARKFECAI